MQQYLVEQKAIFAISLPFPLCSGKQFPANLDKFDVCFQFRSELHNALKANFVAQFKEINSIPVK